MTATTPPEFTAALASAHLVILRRLGLPAPEPAAGSDQGDTLTVPAPLGAYLDRFAAVVTSGGRLAMTTTVPRNRAERRHGGGATVQGPSRRADDPQVIDELARILVAVTGAPTCAHLRRTPDRSTVARLWLHRMDCTRCARTTRRDNGGDEGRCDWCGGRRGETAQPTGLDLPGFLVLGTACEPCAGALTPAGPTPGEAA